MGQAAADRIRRFIDRGLARYGRGQLREAVIEWEQALAVDGSNTEARTLIEFVQSKLLVIDANGDPDTRETDPMMPRFEDFPPNEDSNPYGHEAPTRIAREGDLPLNTVDDEAETGEHPKIKRPTVESPIPQLLAQITSPLWEAPAEHDEAAPEIQVFGENTRRLGSGPHDPPPRVPPTAEPTADRASGARVAASELLDRCRSLIERGNLEAAAAAAEQALREAEQAPPPGISEVIEPARPLLERAFESFVGRAEGIPILAMSEGALASQGLDHRAGFLVSRIDGTITIEHLLDIAGMSRFEALRILAALIRARTIKIL